MTRFPFSIPKASKGHLTERVTGALRVLTDIRIAAGGCSYENSENISATFPCDIMVQENGFSDIGKSDIEKIQLVGQLPRESSTQHRSGVSGILNAVSGALSRMSRIQKVHLSTLRARPTDSTLTTGQPPGHAFWHRADASAGAPSRAAHEGPPPDERRAQVDVASLERPSPQVAADLQYPAAE